MHAFIHLFIQQVDPPSTLLLVLVLWKGRGAVPEAVKTQHCSVIDAKERRASSALGHRRGVTGSV